MRGLGRTLVMGAKLSSGKLLQAAPSCLPECTSIYIHRQTCEEGKAVIDLCEEREKRVKFYTSCSIPDRSQIVEKMNCDWPWFGGRAVLEIKFSNFILWQDFSYNCGFLSPFSDSFLWLYGTWKGSLFSDSSSLSFHSFFYFIPGHARPPCY